MTDVFISYKREERPLASRLAAALESAGWTVWWDLELVGGEHFDDRIQAELDKARCVVVLWSKRSVASRFVKDEATYALEEGKLLPARVDNAGVPLRFRNLHTVNLVKWRETEDDAELQELIGHITKRIGAPSVKVGAEGGAPSRASGKRRSPRANPSVFQDTFKDGSKGPEMVCIDGGTFWMGSPESEKGRRGDERRHRVKVHGFAIGKYAVTFADYDRFCGATWREKPEDEGWGRATQPVIHVDWNDAVAYAEWLSDETGKHYRLPTEAQWEYAARAGTETAYWWGDTVDKNRANCRGCGSQWDNQQTAPVGSFPANPWELHDTAGNVLEWTCSRYDRAYGGAETSCAEPDSVGLRAVRGGSWGLEPEYMRSADRGRYTAGSAFSFVGFRLAQDL